MHCVPVQMNYVKVFNHEEQEPHPRSFEMIVAHPIPDGLHAFSQTKCWRETSRQSSTSSLRSTL